MFKVTVTVTVTVTVFFLFTLNYSKFGVVKIYAFLGGKYVQSKNLVV